MANNQYVNKVEYGNQTVMDITDTTAEEQDVDSGKVFYKANGERSTGTGSMSGAVWGQITGTLSDQSDLNTALNKKYGTDDNETTSISDNDTIPFSTPLGVKARIAFSRIKNLISSAFRKLLKDTVGWIGNNLADMSKVEIGINASGTANTKKARLIMSCESSKTYYVSASGTNRFTSVDYLTTATIPPEFPILQGGSLPYSIDTRSTDKYIIFQFNKETDVTQDDINVLKFMVSETNGDVYNPYHPSVEQCKFDRAEQRVLGAYNLCDVSNASNATNFVSALDTDGTIHFKDVSSVGWSSTYIGKINIVEGVKYKISAHDNAIKYGRVGMSKSATAIPSSSTYPNITVDANTGNPSAPNILLPYTKDNSFVANETATVYLWFANDVETASHATFDVKISLVVVSSSNEVPPYAMTNRELTEKVQSIQSVGTIVANSSLNDYYKTGDYYSNTGSNTATLSDKPSDLAGAFRLSVICGDFPLGQGSDSVNYPIAQKIELVNGATPAIYMRQKNGGTGTYGSWYKFTGTVVS